MAPPARWPPPETVIVGLLAQARRRGYSFDRAWWLVVDGGGQTVLTNSPAPPRLAIRWPTDNGQRVAAQQAILGCRDAFRRAYCREPATPGDLAVVALAALLADEPGRDPSPRQPPLPMRLGGAPRFPRAARAGTA